jgi:hypothetical protein
MEEVNENLTREKVLNILEKHGMYGTQRLENEMKSMISEFANFPLLATKMITL